MNNCEWHIRIEGRVQGIGFRATVFRLAKIQNIFGFIINKEDGSVEICAQGSESALHEFVESVRRRPGLAVIDHLQIEKFKMKEPFSSFTVR